MLSANYLNYKTLGLDIFYNVAVIRTEPCFFVLNGVILHPLTNTILPVFQLEM